MVKSPAQSGRMKTLIHPGPVAGVHVKAAKVMLDALHVAAKKNDLAGVERSLHISCC